MTEDKVNKWVRNKWLWAVVITTVWMYQSYNAGLRDSQLRDQVERSPITQHSPIEKRLAGMVATGLVGHPADKHSLRLTGDPIPIGDTVYLEWQTMDTVWSVYPERLAELRRNNPTWSDVPNEVLLQQLDPVTENKLGTVIVLAVPDITEDHVRNAFCKGRSMNAATLRHGAIVKISVRDSDDTPVIGVTLHEGDCK